MWLSQMVFFLVVSLLCWVVPAAAQHRVTIGEEVQNDKYTVRLLQQEAVGYKTDQTPKWTFAVTNKETHREAVLQMQNETDEIEELALVNDVLVVLGSNRKRS